MVLYLMYEAYGAEHGASIIISFRYRAEAKHSVPRPPGARRLRSSELRDEPTREQLELISKLQVTKCQRRSFTIAGKDGTGTGEEVSHANLYVKVSMK